MLKLLSGTALATAMLAGGALASPIDYVKLSVGQSLNSEVNGFALNDEMAYGVAAGKEFGPFRGEVAVDRLSGSVGGVVQGNALDYSASLLLDLPFGDNVSLFGGAGVDYVDGEASGFGPSVEASGQGWHWTLGAGYRLNERMTGEVQFRRVSVDDLDGLSLDTDELTFGLRLAL